MSKYRIVKTKGKYWPEKKGWLFWNALEYFWYGDFPFCQDYNTLEEAEQAIDKFIENAKYIIVKEYGKV